MDMEKVLGLASDVKKEVVVSFTGDALREIAEDRIKEDTGLDVGIYVDYDEIHEEGLYYFMISSTDELSKKEYDLLNEHYYDIDDVAEFTHALAMKMFNGFGNVGFAQELKGEYIAKGMKLPVTFTLEEYERMITIN